MKPVLVALVLAGCMNPWQAEGNAPPERVAAALERWTDHGLPVGDCEGIVVAIYVGVPQAELLPACGCPDCSACSHYEWSGDASRWLLLIGDNHYPLEFLIEHEFRHVLSACSGLHEDGDGDHLDPAVWFKPMDDRGEYDYARFGAKEEP